MQSDVINVRVERVEELHARGDRHKRHSAALRGTPRLPAALSPTQRDAWAFRGTLTCASKVTAIRRNHMQSTSALSGTHGHFAEHSLARPR